MEVFVVMAFITFCIFMVGVCKISFKESKGNKRIPVRNIPDSYFKGYRRLANTRSDVKEKSVGLVNMMEIGFVVLICGILGLE